MDEKQRTPAQNRSAHKLWEELAREANHHGITLKVLIQNLTVEVTPESVKMIAQEIGRVKYGKSHSSDWTTKELSNVCEEVIKIFAEQGIEMVFPSFEQQEFNNYYGR